MNSLQRSIGYLGLICGLTAISGCLEITSHTEVRRDGSLQRTYTFSGDSAEAMTQDYPLPVDSTWLTTFRETEKGKFERTITKSFPDDRELNALLTDTTRQFVHVRVALEERFRWFFTELRYSETYQNFNPFRSVPLSDFVPASLVEQFYRHEVRKEPFASKDDSLAMVDAGQRFEEWRQRSVFASYYNELARGVELLNDPALTLPMLAAQKERLFKLAGPEILGKNWDTVTIIVQSVLKSPRIRQAMALNADGFAQLKSKVDFMNTVLERPYTASITMPGLILETNAPTVTGNTATWKEVPTFAYIGDYDLWVVSRVVNWWMVVLAGVLVLAALGTTIGTLLRRRTRTTAGL
jgi:hypothetical protein